MNFLELSERFWFSPELLLKIYQDNFPGKIKSYLYELNNREIGIMEMLLKKYGEINR